MYKKEACRKNRPLMNILYMFPHGDVAHDYLNLEKRHHHDVNITFTIFSAFCLIALCLLRSAYLTLQGDA